EGLGHGAGGAEPAGHLDAALRGRAGDQPAVADVYVQLALGAGLERMNELRGQLAGGCEVQRRAGVELAGQLLQLAQVLLGPGEVVADEDRSEEHTSELQSLTNLVCRLLLEKKKNKTY